MCFIEIGFTSIIVWTALCCKCKHNNNNNNNCKINLLLSKYTFPLLLFFFLSFILWYNFPLPQTNMSLHIWRRWQNMEMSSTDITPKKYLIHIQYAWTNIPFACQKHNSLTKKCYLCLESIRLHRMNSLLDLLWTNKLFFLNYNKRNSKRFVILYKKKKNYP